MECEQQYVSQTLLNFVVTEILSPSPNQKANQGVRKTKKALTHKQKARKEAMKLKAVGFSEQLESKGVKRTVKAKEKKKLFNSK